MVDQPADSGVFSRTDCERVHRNIEGGLRTKTGRGADSSEPIIIEHILDCYILVTQGDMRVSVQKRHAQ